MTNITEVFVLNALPDILWVAHRTDNIYYAYVGERILDKPKTDIKKLSELGEEYNCRLYSGRCVTACLELEPPSTGITTEEFLLQISDQFIPFRETLTTALGGVRTTTLTGVEVYEVITGFPKESMIPFRF